MSCFYKVHGRPIKCSLTDLQQLVLICVPIKLILLNTRITAHGFFVIAAKCRNIIRLFLHVVQGL